MKPDRHQLVAISQAAMALPKGKRRALSERLRERAALEASMVVVDQNLSGDKAAGDRAQTALAFWLAADRLAEDS